LNAQDAEAPVSSNSLTDVPEQSHEAMQAASERAIGGPAATDVLAAGGGLELPGREKSAGPPHVVGMDRTALHEPIPGEHDGTTLTHREPGAMGGAFNGADNVTSVPASVADDQTLREWIREGGGRVAERQFEKQQRGRR
jgi:hypothetical protein